MNYRLKVAPLFLLSLFAVGCASEAPSCETFEVPIHREPYEKDWTPDEVTYRGPLTSVSAQETVIFWHLVKTNYYPSMSKAEQLQSFEKKIKPALPWDIIPATKKEIEDAAKLDLDIPAAMVAILSQRSKLEDSVRSRCLETYSERAKSTYGVLTLDHAVESCRLSFQSESDVRARVDPAMPDRYIKMVALILDNQIHFPDNWSKDRKRFKELCGEDLRLKKNREKWSWIRGA